MAYVINKHCLGERYAVCVDVCPTNSIYPGEYNGEVFMVIDPDTCIDCGACMPECPVNAITPGDDADAEWTKVNADLAPKFKDNAPVTPRPASDAPRKPH